MPQQYALVGAVVLRNQDAGAPSRAGQADRRASGPISGYLTNGFFHGGRRGRGSGYLADHGEPECGTFPHGAAQTDLAAHHLDQLLGDGQPQAGAAILARGGCVGLNEGREQVLGLVLANSNSRVGDGNEKRRLAGRLALHLDEDFHLSAFGELDGIGRQVQQDLAQAVRIAAQQRRHFRRHPPAKSESFGGRAAAQGREGVLRGAAQVEVHALQLDLLRLDLGQVEDVVNQGQQRPPAVFNNAGVFALFRRETGLEQQLQHAQDAIHGRADFVAHVGQETAFRNVGGVRGLARGNQFRLVALPFGDIFGDAGDANQLPGLVADRESPVAYPFLLAVGRADAVFRIDRLLHLAREQYTGMFQVVGVDRFRPGLRVLV